MPHLSDRSERRACGSVEGDKRGRDRMPAHEKIHFTSPARNCRSSREAMGGLAFSIQLPKCAAGFWSSTYLSLAQARLNPLH
jgi:hypothetical protein